MGFSISYMRKVGVKYEIRREIFDLLTRVLFDLAQGCDFAFFHRRKNEPIPTRGISSMKCILSHRVIFTFTPV